MSNLLSFENPVFKLYALAVAGTALNMIIKAPLTARQRFAHGAFANPEDAKSAKQDKPRTNENVERVRRAHLNDLENVPVFWALGFIFVLIDPTESSARNHFLGFLAARVAHSFFYLCQIPQPTRGLAFFAGVGIVGSMAVQIIQKAL
ncbi:unnamed protein product [Oikopleura dioica]|uniref:Microsomal glutathione S-transferase 1 n=1 Tax=Oikopleura dioica TaxID=34765 RepID=E4XW41_OIKDI|nr:unnamed protein product [Oikopleura dioica]